MISFTFDFSELDSGMLRTSAKVISVAKQAVERVSEEIILDAKDQVPKDTRTLLNSTDVEISEEMGMVTATFGFAVRNDPLNPKNNLRASQYVYTVHEDLSAYHPVGKAKFLEDPFLTHAPAVGERFQSMFGSRFF